MKSSVDIARHASRSIRLTTSLLIIFGVVAVGSLFLFAVAVNAIITWLILLTGVVHLILAFQSHYAGRRIEEATKVELARRNLTLRTDAPSDLPFKLPIGLAYLIFGAYLIMHSAAGAGAHALMLASPFLIQGISSLVMFFIFSARSFDPSRWWLVDGIITFLLGLIIYLQWPSSSALVTGSVVGVSLIISGATRVMVWA